MSDDLAARADTAIQIATTQRNLHVFSLRVCEAKSDYEGHAGKAKYHADSIARYEKIIEALNDLIAERSRNELTTTPADNRSRNPKSQIINPKIRPTC